jgi:hypothetical protein
MPDDNPLNENTKHWMTNISVLCSTAVLHLYLKYKYQKNKRKSFLHSLNDKEPVSELADFLNFFHHL